MMNAFNTIVGTKTKEDYTKLHELVNQYAEKIISEFDSITFQEKHEATLKAFLYEFVCQIATIDFIKIKK